mmetsp:Transcript_141/g.357  ORF Transcript_141/g.357 Transcript_141/m.357 type:complete len:325 (+) Transcript_141:398-1372(+)
MCAAATCLLLLLLLLCFCFCALTHLRALRDEPLRVFAAERLELGVRVVRNHPLVADGGQERGGDVLEQADLERADLRDVDLVQEALGCGVDNDHLLFDGHGHELILLEHLSQARSAVEQVLRGGVKVRPELRKRRHLTVLRKLQLERARDLLHRLGLRRRSHARHRQADVDGRAHALEEELGLEEDLTIGDGDDVGGNVRRDVTALRLHHRERSHGAGAHGVGQLGRALEQAGVEVENVSRERLAPGRPPQEQRHLTVRDRLFRKVVVDDERVHAVVTEVLRHCASGIGREELQRCGVRCGSGHNDRVRQRALRLQHLHQLCHR